MLNPFQEMENRQRMILKNYDQTHKDRCSYLLSKPKESRT
jgi:hypothetical protein